MERKPAGAVKRALIFANGDLTDLEAAQNLIQPGDLLIAADGGLRHVLALGLTPSVLIGDLDSAAVEDVKRMEEAGVPIELYPQDKNETDLELALSYAVQAGASSIRILGALGGRFDQALGNLFLLGLPALEGLDARLNDGREEVFLIRRSAQIQGKVGDTVSLLPLDDAAHGITTNGLHFPLRGETLYRQHSRGISNRMDQDNAMVSVEEGMLICIHSRKK